MEWPGDGEKSFEGHHCEYGDGEELIHVLDGEEQLATDKAKIPVSS